MCDGHWGNEIPLPSVLATAALLPVCCIVGAEETTVSEEKSLEAFSLKSNTTELSTPASVI